MKQKKPSGPERQDFVTDMAEAHCLGSFEKLKLRRTQDVRKSVTDGGAACFANYKKLCDEKGEVVAAALIEQPNCVKQWLEGLDNDTKLKWPNTHEFMSTQTQWSWGETASGVVGSNV